MMQSVDVARTHEILARYRPIAPRPPMQIDTAAVQASGEKQQGPASPAAAATRLPSRSPRSRKRGRGSAVSAAHAFAAQLKKARASSYPPLLLPSPGTSAAGAASQMGCHQAARLGLAAVQGLARGYPVFPLLGAAGLQMPGSVEQQRTAASPGIGGGGGDGSGGDLLTLSLLTPCDGQSLSLADAKKTLELNAKLQPVTAASAVAPVEKDLLGALNHLTPSSVSKSTVIVPQPIRPVGSSISVGSITEDEDANLVAPADKRPEEVEEEVESDSLPAIVSDSNNRVRLANSAYREMVGQPECPWLGPMMTSAVSSACRAAATTKRISGEVMLGFQEESRVPASSNGFSCKVKIEWARDGRKTLVTAPCHVVRVACKTKDYVFTWRFHTDEASVTNSSA